MIIQLATFFKSQITIRWDLNDKGSVVFSLSYEMIQAEFSKSLSEVHENTFGSGIWLMSQEVVYERENIFKAI